MKRIFSTLFVCLIFISTISLSAQVRVAKSARDKNPRVKFRGISGDAALSQAVADDLRNCGWFDVTTDNAADYQVGGSAAGGRLRLDLYSGAGAALQSVQAAPAGDPRWTSHKAVDGLLQYLFKVKGVCSSRIAFSAETSPGVKEILLADYDGRNVRAVTRNGRLSVESNWAPGGRRLVYTRYSRSTTDIIEYDLGSAQSRRMVAFPGLNAGAAMSPSGNHLALILSKDRRVDLYIKAVNSGSSQRLSNDEAAEASPCWSPQGDRICYVSGMAGNPRLYVIAARGGAAQRLPTQGNEAVSPDWSGDNVIAYSAKMGPNYAIAVCDLSNKEPARVVTRTAGDWESPSWAPDARHVVCSRTQGRRSTLMVVDTWTGKTRELFSTRYNLTMPDWSDLVR
jgi:TolB protein